ncbi:DUF5028 domain-containing protein [Bacillus sp. A116_S68]|jgi:hypothetical protein|nr:DUF5028 domain-containing protein [Bacillus sp. A116_S68]
MKKKAITLIIISLLTGIGARIWYVNKEVDIPPLATFQMGEEVAIEKDFFLDDFENMDGYTVAVNKAEIIPYQEFLAKYNYIDDEDAPLFEEDNIHYPEMVYDLQLTIKNTNKTDDLTEHSGINFINYHLTGTDFLMQINDQLYSIANPELEAGMTEGFRLRPESEMDFNLPFFFAPSTNVLPIQTKAVLNDEVYLVVSLYPNVKRILIE